MKFTSPSIKHYLFLTEITPLKDDRIETPKMLKAIKQELENLINRGTFMVVLR